MRETKETKDVTCQPASPLVYNKRRRPPTADDRETPASDGSDTMPTMNVDNAQVHLREIIAGLNPGEQLVIVIVQDGERVATLTRRAVRQWPCKAGSARTTTHWMAPDFDAPLDDFREYME
jgi:hypothetical protein